MELNNLQNGNAQVMLKVILTDSTHYKDVHPKNNFKPEHFGFLWIGLTLKDLTKPYLEL